MSPRAILPTFNVKNKFYTQKSEVVYKVGVSFIENSI